GRLFGRQGPALQYGGTAIPARVSAHRRQRAGAIPNDLPRLVSGTDGARPLQDPDSPGGRPRIRLHVAALLRRRSDHPGSRASALREQGPAHGAQPGRRDLPAGWRSTRARAGRQRPRLRRDVPDRAPPLVTARKPFMRRLGRLAWSLSTLCAVAPLPAAVSQSPAADPADVGTIEAIVHAYYDVINGPAGVPRQWRRDSTLYTEEAPFLPMPEPGRQ